MGRPDYHKYTAQEEAWLRENVSRYPYAELARRFNGRFSANVSRDSVSDKCSKRMKILRGQNTGRFAAGNAGGPGGGEPHKPAGTQREYLGYTWVKAGRTYTPAASEASLSADNPEDWARNPAESVSEGAGAMKAASEASLSGGDTKYPSTKLEDKQSAGREAGTGKKTNEAFRADWKLKHRLAYEQSRGPVPAGWIVVFLDGDKRNCDPANLCAVPRSVHARMCKNRWYTHSAEHTRAAIRLCELNEAMKG